MSATRIHIDGIVLIVSLFFASFFILLVSSFYILNTDIELKLISDVREQFEAEELQYNIDFKGRDGILTGTVASEKEGQKAVKIAESVEGVRVIRNQLTIIKNDSKNSLDTSLSGISGIIEDTNNLDTSFSAISRITEDTNKSDASFFTVSEITKDNNKKEEKSVNNITSLVSISSDSDTVTEEKENHLEYFTEITEKPIIEEFVISFKSDSTKLSSEHESSLNSVIIKMMNNPLLCVEMSSSHTKSAVAIKRANLIKDFFAKQGIGKERFDVIWDGSGEKNSVQLKLFQNE